eukprot:TRINITY_DN21362_c0_g1_i1.p1 TRINITY_DN21362_c0_g1~~TRINITY_DN21362_c0_g1_i1.p1  ORF type:complete len:580 (+),score=114.93 TRINITY_DN21362_c0_g1_i1:62-1801(+)
MAEGSPRAAAAPEPVPFRLAVTPSSLDGVEEGSEFLSYAYPAGDAYSRGCYKTLYTLWVHVTAMTKGEAPLRSACMRCHGAAVSAAFATAAGHLGSKDSLCVGMWNEGASAEEFLEVPSTLRVPRADSRSTVLLLTRPGRAGLWCDQGASDSDHSPSPSPRGAMRAVTRIVHHPESGTASLKLDKGSVVAQVGTGAFMRVLRRMADMNSCPHTLPPPQAATPAAECGAGLSVLVRVLELLWGSVSRAAADAVTPLLRSAAPGLLQPVTLGSPLSALPCPGPLREAARGRLTQLLMQLDSSSGTAETLASCAGAVALRAGCRYVPCGSMLAVAGGCAATTLSRTVSATVLFYLSSLGLAGGGDAAGKEEVLVDGVHLEPPAASSFSSFQPCVVDITTRLRRTRSAAEQPRSAGILVAVRRQRSAVCMLLAEGSGSCVGVSRDDAVAALRVALDKAEGEGLLSVPALTASPLPAAVSGLTTFSCLSSGALIYPHAVAPTAGRARAVLEAYSHRVRSQLRRPGTCEVAFSVSVPSAKTADSWVVCAWRPSTDRTDEDVVVCHHSSVPRDLARLYCTVAAAVP